jgi:hypothetical protein
MDKDIMMLTLRIPKDVHTKLKIISAIDNVSMTQVIIDLIGKVNLQYPGLTQSKPVKAIKKATTKKDTKKVKPVSDADKEKSKTLILKLRDQGLSLSEIAKELENQGIPTAKGNIKWQKGTVGKLIKNYAAIPVPIPIP